MTDISMNLLVDQLENSMASSHWLTPQNLADERVKFLANPSVDPQLVYPEFDKRPLKEAILQLEHLTCSSEKTLQNWYLRRKIEAVRLKMQLFLHLNNPEFTSLSCQLYTCTFQPEYLAQAKKDAASPLPFISSENKTSAEIIDGIITYLQQYKITDWTVELSTASDFYFRVKARKKQILIGRIFNWDFTDFDCMLAHEIDGHVLRAMNAQRQSEPILQKQFPFYSKTEEGLASFLGDYCSTTAEINRKHHALKYLAGEMAKTHSFTDVFHFLVDSGFTPELAFQRTFRLKRGISDTSQPGVFAREAMYYEGMLEVKKYIDEGGNIEKLYSGKVGLADLEYIPQISGVLVPERLKTYIKGKQ